MLKLIDRVLKKLSPSLHARLKQGFRAYKKKANPKLTREEFISLLRNELKIHRGATVFIHSSMRNLYLDFDKGDILGILREVVGPDGTLAFPCWQFNTRAEDYIKENKIVFDLRNSPSAMGKLPDELRKDPAAFRSFHPTNSVVAIGKNAKELTEGHELDIYPCGVQSPFYKLIKFNARILGLGVTVDNLTFVHSVEDTMKSSFPLKTRNDEVYDCLCIDSDGKEKIVKTLVASAAISHRNVYDFFKKYIPASMYRNVRVKNMDFFSLDSPELFDQLKQLASSNKTIYHY